MRDDDIGREHHDAVAHVLSQIEEELNRHTVCYDDHCYVLENMQELVEDLKRRNNA